MCGLESRYFCSTLVFMILFLRHMCFCGQRPTAAGLSKAQRRLEDMGTVGICPHLLLADTLILFKQGGGGLILPTTYRLSPLNLKMSRRPFQGQFVILWANTPCSIGPVCSTYYSIRTYLGFFKTISKYNLRTIFWITHSNSYGVTCFFLFLL